MKQYIFIFLMGIANDLYGQNYQQEINEQVWKPFIKTFSEYDTKGFLDLHAKDVVRSPRDAKVVWDWNEYFLRQQQGDDRERKAGSKRKLELRFTERIADKHKAIEVGIYKTTVIDKDGTSKSFYGRFHVVLRKEPDTKTWKIVVDTDSSEGDTIGKEDFLKAQPLE